MSMSEALGLLEQRVSAAVDLIASLRDRVARLEQELEALHAGSAAEPPSEPSCEPALLEELARLRTERRVVRERIHELVKEIDRVSW